VQCDNAADALLAERTIEPCGHLAPLGLCLAADTALAADYVASDSRDVFAACSEAGRSSHRLFAYTAAAGLTDESAKIGVAHSGLGSNGGKER
jgi:hypothetical protein